MFGHAWDDKNLRPRNVDGLHLVELMCLRCGTTRHDYWGAHGAVRRRRYSYSEGYLVANKDDRLSRDEYRLHVLADLIGGLRKARNKRG